jgi:hypothetical protein
VPFEGTNNTPLEKVESKRLSQRKFNVVKRCLAKNTPFGKVYPKKIKYVA